MSVAIPSLLNTPSCGAQLKHRDNFTFTFITFLSPFVVMKSKIFFKIEIRKDISVR
jgi:hypothetical protein